MLECDKRNQTVVKLNNVSLHYSLYRSQNDRIKEALHPYRKKYHKIFFALKDINLEINKGEILGVVGRNGSGKSTLLKIITGVLAPSTGSVQVKGALAAILELGAGFHPDYTGIENIYFYGSVLGLKREFLESQIDSIVKFTNIGEFINQPIKTYSSGMKARLAFAVNTAIDPDILILDEVLAVGDSLFQRKCYAKMEEFLKKGKTIIFVSHSIASVNEMCTKAILIDNGEMILEGSAELVTMNYSRLLFERSENVESLRKDLIKLNLDIPFKNRFTTKKQESSFSNKGSKVEPNKKSEKIETNYLKAELFPEMLTESKITQKNMDVDIHSIKMKTVTGETVNMLVSGEKYVFSYKVMFNVSLNNVLLNYIIKTTRGIKLSGARYPKIKRPIPEVAAGIEYQCDWKFDCKLLKGKYYCNVNVYYFVEGERKVATMIRDAFLFEVRERKDENKQIESSCIFDMGQQLTVTLTEKLLD